MRIGTLVLAAAVMGIASVSQAAPWTGTAFNDCYFLSYGSDHSESGMGLNNANTTSIGGAGPTSSGTLQDISTGSSTGITMAMAGFGGQNGDVAWSLATAWPAGGEASAAFSANVPNSGGDVTNNGTMSFTFSGLDTSGNTQYELKFASYHAVADTNVLGMQISGATSFVNATDMPTFTGSGGVHVYSNTSSSSTAWIHEDGTYLVDFTQIIPGSNGTVVVTGLSPQSGDNGWPVMSAVQLIATSVPEPSSLALAGLALLPMLRRRRA
jgi:MYXO-CTERM domain-containing protein